MSPVRMNTILSWLFIFVGFVLFIVAAGDLAIRLVAAIFSLALVNYGFRLQGMPSLYSIFQITLDRLRFFH